MSVYDEIMDGILWVAEQEGNGKEARRTYDKIKRRNASEEKRNRTIKEDTVKQGSHWVNKGKEGTHGKFKTKKAADAQRRAMFANSDKNRNFGEGLNESFKEMIDWDGLNFEIYDKLSNYLRENPEVYFEEPTPMSNGDTQVKFEILWGGDEDGFATVDIKGKMYGNPNIIHFVGKENSQKLVMEFDCRSVKEMINNILDYIEF